MGGNAIKTAKRISKEQFNVAVRELGSILDSAGIWHQVVPAYRNKESFGDIDIVVSKGLSEAQVKALFNSSEAIKNSNVVSFAFDSGDLPTIQVDLIYQDEQSFDFAVSYFSYNDLGNLIGRIAHKLGMRFGHDGLWLLMRDGTNLFHKILLTADFGKSLEILDLDYQQWLKGFDDLVGIFEFVRSSKFFNSDIYLLDNRNAIARTRDRKRKTYTEFLAYNKANPLTRYTFVRDKSFYLPLIFSKFNVAGEYFEAIEDLRLKTAAKLMFNGDLVRELTGLQGKELGEFIQDLKARNPMLCDHRLILNMTDAEIEGIIKNHEVQ